MCCNFDFKEYIMNKKHTFVDFLCPRVYITMSVVPTLQSSAEG